MKKATFTEIGRVRINDARDVVISTVLENGTLTGLHINSFVRTNNHTGFTKGGVFVPEDKVVEFGELVKTVLAS